MTRFQRFSLIGGAGALILLAVVALPRMLPGSSPTPVHNAVLASQGTVAPSDRSAASAGLVPTGRATVKPATGRPNAEGVHRARPGLLEELAKKRGRPLSLADRQAVHDALRTTVEEWRSTQTEFNDDAAALLHTTPEVIDETLPRKGWARVGATRDAGWSARLEKALNRRLSPEEHDRLDRLVDEKHAKIWSARERASARMAQSLGMREAEVDSAWPWPGEPHTPVAPASPPHPSSSTEPR